MQSRREFYKTLSLSGIGLSLSNGAYGLTNASQKVFRFAVASDLHFGQEGTPYKERASLLVSKLNKEKESHGLDAVFLNGDIGHDSALIYDEVKQDYLSKLTIPYYAIKGNHDFIDGKVGSPGESWEKIWGYPSNHVIRQKNLAFIMADTSAPRDPKVYRPANIDWLTKQLETLRDTETVFVLLHIAQRKEGVLNWPPYGVGHHNIESCKEAEQVMRLLESYPNVKAIFHGHCHRVSHCYLSGGKPYFFLGRVGALPESCKSGYRIVEAYSNSSFSTFYHDILNDTIYNKDTF